MQHNSPCTAPGTYPCNTPGALVRPPQAEPARRDHKPGRAARLLAYASALLRPNPHIRQLPIGHPDALVQRPGERRIVLGHNVLIITAPKPGKASGQTRKD